MNGILIVNKPTGMTSHDVVAIVRRKFNMRRVGHSGTLDPLATGVLVMLLGESTRLFRKFESFDKAYKATLILGMKTNTADIQGEVIKRLPYENFTQQAVEEVLNKFVGESDQVPPMVSAVKLKGRRLYELARQGLDVPRQARRIKIQKLNLIKFDIPNVRFYVECSKGTYVRKLAEDIGEKLGSVACISEIERTKVGPFLIEEAVTLEELNVRHVRDWQG